MGLTGKRVVVTRRPEQSERLSSALRERGATVLSFPTIAIEPPESWAEVDDAIRKLATGGYDWVAFTSANAVDKFFSRLGCMPGEVFRSVKVSAVGGATEALLKEKGIAVDLIPDSFTGVELAAALGRGPGRILLPRAEDVPPDMVEVLRANGWDTDEVTAYRTVPASPSGEDADAVLSGTFDVVTFTSASTVKGFAAIVGDPSALGLAVGQAPVRSVACIGPITARACAEVGMRSDVVARVHTTGGLVDALVMAT